MLSYSNLLVDILTFINPSCISELILESVCWVGLHNLTLKCLLPEPFTAPVFKFFALVEWFAQDQRLGHA